MSRYIDADALNMYERLKSYYGDAWRDAQEEIDSAPTIDAVPVIRCKDCKHHGEQYGTGYCMKDGCYGWYDEDYCSRAERRGEE